MVSVKIKGGYLVLDCKKSFVYFFGKAAVVKNLVCVHLCFHISLLRKHAAVGKIFPLGGRKQKLFRPHFFKNIFEVNGGYTHFVRNVVYGLLLHAAYHHYLRYNF